MGKRNFKVSGFITKSRQKFRLRGAVAWQRSRLHRVGVSARFAALQSEVRCQ